MTPLIIVPARLHSKGVPRKNFRPLPDGTTLIGRAVEIGQQLGQVVVTTDNPDYVPPKGVTLILRPPQLAQDDTPMSAVVENVLALVPGPALQPIMLLQPTTPFRDLVMLARILELSYQTIATVAFSPSTLPRTVALNREEFIETPVARQVVRVVFTGSCYAWQRNDTFPSFPRHWRVAFEPPQLNIDTPRDWRQLCRLIRGKSQTKSQTKSEAPDQIVGLA